MNYEQAVTTVVDLLGAQTVVDHAMNIAPSNRVQVAFVLAVNNNGSLSADDVTTINMVDEAPLLQRPDSNAE